LQSIAYFVLSAVLKVQAQKDVISTFAGHTRTVPMPGWVKAFLDDWLQAANLTAGKLFRRVNKNGSACGDGMTEKAVWHVCREHARKAVLKGSQLMISGGHAVGCAILRVAS